MGKRSHLIAYKELLCAPNGKYPGYETVLQSNTISIVTCLHCLYILYYIRSTFNEPLFFLQMMKEIHKTRDELSQKVSDTQRLQMELQRRNTEEKDNSLEKLRRAIVILENENSTLKVSVLLGF